LIIIKETTISFQAKHPNLDLTFEIFTLEEKTQKNIITSKTPNMKRKKNSNLIKENQMFIIIIFPLKYNLKEKIIKKITTIKNCILTMHPFLPRMFFICYF
jgi:hypothetical protein